MMKFPKPLLAAAIYALVGGAFIPAPVYAEAQIYFKSPPPPARFEVVPAPRHGHVWAPGYWDQRGKRRSWRSGRWERERSGHHYVQPRWVERNNRWAFQRGSWNRGDRDGDGIRNSRDRDRDGDGAPNNRDSSPDNPHRR